VARGKPADELAALEARYQERVNEIKARFQEQLEDWQGWDAGAAGAEAARTGAFWFPTDPERAVREQEAALAELEPLRREIERLRAEAKRGPGRPELAGAEALPIDVFWNAVSLLLGGESARAVEAITRLDQDRGFVNKEKAGEIKQWVDAAPAEARRALADREIPENFPVTDDGVLIPRPKTA
jgi:hypothetical protein